MTLSKPSYKRMQPLLGSWMWIELHAEDDLRDPQRLLTSAFDEARRLEKIFNLFDAKSTLSRFNRQPLGSPMMVDPAFAKVLQRALMLGHDSRGAFWPIGMEENPSVAITAPSHGCDNWAVTRWQACTFDLNGIAKGSIVDQLCDWICAQDAEARGVVNAGGDLRFFGALDPLPPVALRLGTARHPVHKHLPAKARAVASSSRHAAGCFDKPWRRELSGDATVVAMASTCMVADGLTKVGLCGTPAVIRHCCTRYGAQVLVFDGWGAVVESYSI